MEKEEKHAKSLQYYMRVLHRDLGFLALGMVIIYSLSGIILIHRTTDFMKRSVDVEVTIAPNLSENEIGNALKMRNFKATKEENGVIYFSNGQYDKSTGKATYVTKEMIPPFDKFLSLHKLPSASNPFVGWFTTIFGIVLCFLAISSLFMFKVNTKQFKSNMIYTAVGVIISIVLITLLG